MDLYPIIGCALLGAGTVALLIPLILRLAGRYGPGRSRDFHHTHREPVPRFGGLALAAAFLAVEFFVGLFLPEFRSSIPGRLTVVVGSLAMFAVGFWDDVQPLGAKRKLLAQVLVALGVQHAGIGIETLQLPISGEIVELHGWGVVFTVVWLVGITNLMNLIDGVDGLAGGIGLMLMALLVYVGYQNGTFVLLTAGVTGSLVAFLWFNFPPARIYLGDGGAYLVGFQIAVFSLVGSHKGTVVAALMAPLFVLALPIVDTSLAILRRGFRGLPLFRPDRRHIHHRLLATGMSRRKVVLSLYAVTLIFLVIGFAACWSRGELMPVLVGVAVLVILLGAGQLNLAREWLAAGWNLGNSLAVRQEVQYALSLSNWLQHEGDRCCSLDELFEDLVFAGRRLGFRSIELELAGGKRAWSLPARCREACLDQEVNCGEFGVLKMQAAGCLKPGACVGQGSCQIQDRSGPPFEPDARRSEILAELLAEGWAKAAARWRTQRWLGGDAPAWQVVGGEQGLGRAGFTGRVVARAGEKTLPLGRDSSGGLMHAR